MTTRIVPVLGVGLIWASGCYMPIGVEPSPTTSPVQPRRVAPSSAERSVSPNSEPASQLAVRGETIRADEMWSELHDELLERSQNLRPEGYRAYLEQRAAQWVNNQLADALLYHQASLRVSPEMESRINKIVDDEIRKVVTRDYDGVQRRYVRHLESQGRTLDQEHARLRREILIANYLEQEIRPKIVEPTRAELLAMYEANRESWSQRSRRSMSLIDVRLLDRLPKGVDTPTRAQSSAARAEARSTILAAQAALQSGASFAEVARRYSDGLHAADGGAWGWITRGSVRKRFEPVVDVLFKLSPGETSEVIETPDGFSLVRCDEIDAGAERRFEDVQPEIKERHFRVMYNQLIGELVTKLQRSARIDPDRLERFYAAVVETTLARSNDAMMSTPRP